MKKFNKYIIITLILSVFYTLNLNAMVKKDKYGHSLINLWELYYQAKSKDLPKEQLRILKDIENQSFEKKLSWDFYDSGVKYIEVMRQWDWKKVGKAEDDFSKMIRKYNNPFVAFIYSYKKYEQIKKSEVFALKSFKDKDLEPFYKYSGVLTGRIKPIVSYINSPYEFALWAMLNRNFDEWKPFVKDISKEKYPNSAFLEYLRAINIGYANRMGEKHILDSLIVKYKDKGIAYLAEAELLELRKYDKKLETNPLYAKELYNDCKAFLSKIKALPKTEKDFIGKCENVVEIINLLTQQEAEISIDKNILELDLRNIRTGKLLMYKSGSVKKLQEWDVENTKNSFYVTDTLKIQLANYGDGDFNFVFKSGKIKIERELNKYSLSIAQRFNASGYGLYIADYQTGKPLSEVGLKLYVEKEKVEVLKNYHLEKGFTPLPKEFSTRMNKLATYFVQAFSKDSEGRLILSPVLSLGSAGDNWIKNYSGMYGQVYLSQSAFRPGDKVYFQALLYKKDEENHVAIVDDKRNVKAILFDSEGNSLDTLNLKLNDYGTVNGSFILPKDRRNGSFQIEIKDDNRDICYKRFIVDDFTLPGFYVNVKPQEKLYFSGDRIFIQGQVVSYSNRNMSDSKISYSITNNGENIKKGVIYPDSDGNFEFSFASLRNHDWGYYDINIVVTDSNGESHTIESYVSVGDYISFNNDIINKKDIEIALDWNKIKLNKKDYDDSQVVLVSDDSLKIQTNVEQYNFSISTPVNFKYFLKTLSGKELESGDFISGKIKKIGFNVEDGMYILTISTNINRKNFQQKIKKYLLIKHKLLEAKFNVPIKYYFASMGNNVKYGEPFGAVIGSTSAPLWAVAELYDSKANLLENRIIHLDKLNNVQKIEFEFKKYYPTDLSLKIFYFRGNEAKTFMANYHIDKPDMLLPLSFYSFEDKTQPLTSYTFKLKTDKNVACLVSIYDKSLDEISKNYWDEIHVKSNFRDVNIKSQVGSWGSPFIIGLRKNSLLGAGHNICYANYTKSDIALEEKSVNDNHIDIRKDFSSNLGFFPNLVSDSNGYINFSFKTSGKLGTYVISVFAHDKKLKNKLIRRDILVTKPIRLSSNPPKYLYNGDKCVLPITLSSNYDKDLSGILVVTQSSDSTIIAENKFNVIIPKGQSLTKNINLSPKGSSINVKAVFISKDKNLSDGFLIKIPILSSVQNIVENHSAIILNNADKSKIINDLRAAFRNSAGNINFRELSIFDMIKEAVPKCVKSHSSDVLGNMDALFATYLSGKMIGKFNVGDEKRLFSKVLECQNNDGGFAWFAGMQSSPFITYEILIKLSRMRELGGSFEINYKAAVQYLDESLNWDNDSRIFGIDLNYYLYLRSLYPSISFKKSVLDSFRKKLKQIQAYLLPIYDRGLNGKILAKAMRTETLLNLSKNPQGKKLAEIWGLDYDKIQSSVNQDIKSLMQYAVKHEGGGFYYPNAVMPFRGMLENEAFAHSVLCNLMSYYAHKSGNRDAEKIANGIRIWLMIQKTSQKWGDEIGFVDALYSVMQGVEQVKNTKILIGEEVLEKPFNKILESGNGLKVERKFYREEVNEKGMIYYKEIPIGTELHMGDKIRIKYFIHSSENQSFVRLITPFEAGFTPVNQLSGFLYSGFYFPYCYREMKSGKSIYYISLLPEENSEYSQDFYVSREGQFEAPVLEIVSLYSPFYRANSGFYGKVLINR